jgi:hypothetical protein
LFLSLFVLLGVGWVKLSLGIESSLTVYMPLNRIPKDMYILQK